MPLFYAVLTEESPKFSNLKLEDCCSFLELYGRIKLAGDPLKETFFRDVAHIIYLPLNVLTPVPEVSTAKLDKRFCYLLKFIELCHACEELKSIAKCSRFFYQCEEYACKLFEI